MTEQTQQLVAKLAEELASRGEKLTTAESCTGGLIAKTLTDLPGSSVWFDRGFVTYSNEAKTEMISVSASVIDQYGAVSEPVVNAMVTGALKHSAANYAIAVTGVAGPGGGSAEKPVGTVWIGVGSKYQLIARKYVFSGDRDAVRQATLGKALGNLKGMIDAECQVKFREYELAAALQEARADIDAGRYNTENIADHMNRVADDV